MRNASAEETKLVLIEFEIAAVFPDADDDLRPEYDLRQMLRSAEHLGIPCTRRSTSHGRAYRTFPSRAAGLSIVPGTSFLH